MLVGADTLAMAKPASLATNWNNEEANWLKVGQGLLHLRDVLIPETIRVMQEFHAHITTNIVVQDCSCTAENIKKTTKNPPCNTCRKHRLRIIGARTDLETQLIWSNTEPSKWSEDWWEVAKCFIGPGQKNNHGPEDTDSANLFTLWINCSKFATLCTSTVLKKVREMRNTMAHEPDMKCSDAKLEEYFNNMLNVVNDPRLCAHIGQASVAIVARLEEIRDEAFKMGQRDKEKVLEYLVRDPNAHGIVHTDFDTFTDMQNMSLSEGARKLRDVPNAGGSSVVSEVLSYEHLHRCFGAQFVKTEMEVSYFPEGGSMTDYVCNMFNTKLGVSVTRAMKYQGDFEKADALRLLDKKLKGVLQSTRNTLEEWSKQILHVWAMSDDEATVVHITYNDVESNVKANTVVLVTVADHNPDIFPKI